jgi:3',5'-cyclic AMP phosphodiesterase CpdA
VHAFRLLHLSDLHFASIPYRAGIPDWPDVTLSGHPLVVPAKVSSHDPHLAEAAARFAHQTRPDAVVISGDLATTGNHSDLASALEFVESPVGDSPWTNADGRATLRGAVRLENIGILPGNHDRFRGLLLRPNDREFDRIFSRYWPHDRGVEVLVVLAGGDEHLAIVGADFSLHRAKDAKGPLGHLGQGRVNPTTLMELVAETRRVREEYERTAVLWVVHFPPMFPNNGKSLELLDPEALVMAAEQEGIEHLLCGHTHRALTYNTGPSQVLVHCIGTATQYVSGHGQWIGLYDVRVDHGRIAGFQPSGFSWDDGALDFTFELIPASLDL